MSTCPGCKACNEGKIPDFDDEDEEEAFWDAHSPSQFPLRSTQVRLRGRPPLLQRKQRITLMLNPQLKERLVELAEQRGIGYQTLIQDFLLERVAQEFNP
jgi:predicted DNA binding CopG/RHH family protein